MLTAKGQKEGLRKQSHLPLHQKQKQKIFRNKPKEAKVLYSEYKILMKETKDDTNR